jgi:hypothetical protein
MPSSDWVSAACDCISAAINILAKKVVAISTPIVSAMKSRYPLTTLLKAYLNIFLYSPSQRVF